MTDKMPLNILRQRLVFLAQLLLVALAKRTLTLGVGSLNILVGMILADGHQTDALWQS